MCYITALTFSPRNNTDRSGSFSDYEAFLEMEMFSSFSGVSSVYVDFTRSGWALSAIVFAICQGLIVTTLSLGMTAQSTVI